MSLSDMRHIRLVCLDLWDQLHISEEKYDIFQFILIYPVSISLDLESFFLENLVVKVEQVFT